MGDKTIKTRIQLKYDTEENWKKSVLEADGGTKTTTGSSFIPKKGEVILYSTDGTHPFSRLKVGDGITNVVQLPFLGIRFQDIGGKDNIKTKQTAVTDPNVAGGATSNSFIDTISQNTNGEITVTKANLAVASTSSAGIVQLSSAINSTDTDKAATPNAVKAAYDLANSAIPKNIGSNTGDLIYYDSSKDAKYSKLGIGANNSILKVVSGAPSWSALTKEDLGLDNVENTALSTWTGSSNITTVGTISSGTWNGDAIAANKIGELSTAKLTSGILGISRGGTGLDNITADQVLIGGANNSITQRAITSPTSNETFTQYLAQNPAPDNSLIVNLKTLKLAIPPINLSNPISTAGNGYQLSYYAPTSKGVLHSVLIAQGTSTNSQGTEPLWLDPTSLSGVDNTGNGGALFYGRDQTASTTPKPFKTQWGTLPIEQGGTGRTTFPGGQILLGNGMNSITTIEKSSENRNSTIVERDSQGSFKTTKITLSTGLVALENNDNFGDNLILNINNTSHLATFYGKLNSNNLESEIGILKMSRTKASSIERPVIQWYSGKTTIVNSTPTTTEELIGELYWDNTSNSPKAIFKNYYTANNSDTRYADIYKFPSVNTSIARDTEFTLLASSSTTATTNGILYYRNAFNDIKIKASANGALYATESQGALQWGTLPVAQGGTGLTNSGYINAVITGNSSSTSGAFNPVQTQNGAFYATAENNPPVFGTLPIAQGGTGATTILVAKANLGFGVEAHDFSLSNFLGLDQHWGIGAVVQSAEVGEEETDKAFLNKKTFLILTDRGLLSYNTTDSKMVWEFNLNSSNITATVYNTPNENNPGEVKASYKILHKPNDENAIGSATKPIYIDENGLATICGNTLNVNIEGNSSNVTGVIDIAHGGTNANNYDTARTNLRACRWILSQSSVLDQVKTSASSADQAIFFSVDGTSYAGAPTNTNWYDIMAISPTSVGNATTLLAHEYGSNYNLYIGYAWRNGTSQPVWKKLLWTHETDMPQNAANFNTIATANTTTFYRNGFIIPNPATINDGGFLRVRGTSETDTVLELGTWDDSGSGETIQFNYYPTNSQITPTYSVSVPKASGTICLTNGTGASGTWGINISGKLTDSAHSWTATEVYNYMVARVLKAGDTMTGQLHINYAQDVGLNQNGSLIIGPKNGENIGFDNNEMMARNNSKAATLYINSEGGLVYIGSGGIETTGKITAKHGHDFMVAGNEFNFVPDSYNSTVWFNYQSPSRNSSATVSGYLFGNGKGTALAQIDSNGNFSKNAANVTGTVAVGHGGTGATSVSGAQTNLGIRRGTTSGGITVSAGSYKDYAISWSALSSTPTVVVGFSTTSTAGAFGKCCVAVKSDSITKTGCTIRIFNGDSTGRNPNISWVAIG